LQCSIYIAQILNGQLAHDQYNLTNYAAELGDVPYQADQTSRLRRSGQEYVLQCSIDIAQILNGPLAHDQFNLTDYAADLGDVPYQVDQTSRLRRSALLYVGGNSTIWRLLVESRGMWAVFDLGCSTADSISIT